MIAELCLCCLITVDAAAESLLDMLILETPGGALPAPPKLASGTKHCRTLGSSPTRPLIFVWMPSIPSLLQEKSDPW